MKFMINGAVTLGTYDGANIEIKQSCGADNFVQFGMVTEEVNRLRKQGYNPKAFISASKTLQDVISFMEKGIAGDYFPEILDNLINVDPYMVMADFDAYHRAQMKISSLYTDRLTFGKMCLMNIANAGMFSADRAIDDYAQKIWHLPKVK